MIYSMDFEDWNKNNTNPTDESLQSKESHGEEIKLDSPCTEKCAHPEHNDIQSEEESFRDKWLRSIADGENLRRRLEKEKKDGIDYALFRFAKEIIGVADQLSWAMSSVVIETDRSAPLYQGITMTLAELERVFEQFGILKIQAMGEKFDPHLHQVMQEKEDAQHEPGTVVTVLQNGYKLQERLLRPAMVVVVKAPSIDSKCILTNA